MYEITSVVELRNSALMATSASTEDISELDIIYQVPFGEAEPIEMKSTAIVGSRQDLLSLAFFKDIIELDISYGVPIGIADPLDVLATAYIRNRQDLMGRIYIKDTIELNVQERVIQAPIIIQDAKVLQDSYNRRARPTLNQGTSMTLIAGEPAEGTCYTIIDFDLTPLRNALINPKFKVRDIELILTFWGSMYGTMHFYENLTTWYEYSVNWNSNIQKGKHLFDYNLNGEEVVYINVYYLIMDLMNRGINKFWIVIESPDYILIKSRETDSPPTIRMQYFDKTWQAFPGQEMFWMSVNIIANRNRDFNGRVNLIRYTDLYSRTKFVLKKKDLPATVRVRSNNMLESLDAMAIFEPKPWDLQATIDLKNTIDLESTFSALSSYIKSTANIKQIKDLVGTIKILSEIDGSEFSATAYITIANLPGIVQISLMEFLNASVDFVISDREDLNSVVKLDKLKKDLIAKAIFSGVKESDLQATVSIIPSYIKATVSVMGMEALESKAILGYEPAQLPAHALLQTKDKGTLDGTVDIWNFPKHELDATVQFTDVKTYTDRKELNARVRFSKYVPDEIPGTVEFTKIGEDLDATAKLEDFNVYKGFKDLQSRARISRYVPDEIPGTAEFKTPRKTLNATARFQKTYSYQKELGGRVVFWHYKPGEMIGLVKIRQTGENDLPAVADIFNTYGMDSTAVLKQNAEKDLLGRLKIRQSGKQDLEATANIFSINDLKALVTIRQFGDKDFKGITTIRQFGKDDLNAMAQIYQWKDLPMTADVWYYKRLYATAIIRQFDINEMYGTVNFGNSSLFFVDLFQTTIIRQTVRERFDALVKLVNDGVRYWVPDKHAPEVFGPEDNDFKLPRRWKAEDFM